MTKHYPLHHEDAGPLYKKITADEYERLTARIAELERIDTEHTLQIAKMNGYIHHLEEERRWRKFSEEKPDNGQKVLVWLTADGSDGFVLTSTYIDGQWYYGEDPQGCKPSRWMPQPYAPKED